MKKYIRTSDEVMEFSIYEKRKKYATEISHTYTKQIKAQADTIEELCDVFIFKGIDKIPLICDSYDELIYWFNHSKEEQYTTRNCYGAIWTDKGLIYVAKLNEKGEWELI